MTVMISSPRELRQRVTEERRSGKTVGLVPTMGFLHEGHLSLIERSRKENDCTLVSIFVNPLQFCPGEDFEEYPRNVERDRELLEKEGADILFAPSPQEMYAPDRSVFVEETSLSTCLCGASRPGHFRGVCTVVLKLFLAAAPHRAYFGRKDYQQLKIIQRMVRDLNVPVEVRSCPIVRESDGLARSSRNAYLSPEERRAALLLHASLQEARRCFDAGERSAASLEKTVRAVLGQSPLLSPEYVEIRHAETLEPLEEIGEPGVIALAVRAGKTRLIDNCLLGGEDMS